jgi:hypothetical protein
MAAKSEEFIEQGKKFTFKLLTCKFIKPAGLQQPN